MRAVYLLATMLLAIAPSAGVTQTNPNFERAIRRADRQGIILLFKVPVKDAEIARNVTKYSLSDLTTNTAVRLESMSVVTPEKCPYPPGYEGNPTDRICLELSPPAKLDDSHHYALLTDVIALDGANVSPTLVPLDPVGGSVLPITSETARIEATYSLDLSTEANVEPQVTVNSRPVEIKEPADEPGMPRCYGPGSFTFLCTLRWPVRNGDVVGVQLINRATGQPLPYGTIQPTTAKVDAPKKADDAKYFDLTLLLTRKNEETTGSLTARTRDFAIWEYPSDGPRGPVHVAVMPYFDVLFNMKNDGSGRFSVGPQLQLRFFDFLVDAVELRATPRFETDDKFNRQNLMYLDAEVRLAIPGLYSGELPIIGGAYNFFPRAGYERGETIRGSGAVSVEANNPTRGTLGATGKVLWPNKVFLFAGGIELNAELNRLSIRRNPDFPNPPTAHPLFWTVGTTFKVNSNFGISVTKRSGRQPPLFKHLSGFDIGFTWLQ